MKVVLLAAGRSKRLKPIEDKIFLEFMGKSLLQHQLETLAESGFNDFIIVGGKHNLDKIEKVCDPLPYKIHLVEQTDLNAGQAGGVLSALEITQNESLIIVSSNDVVEKDAFKLMAASISDDLDGAIVGKKVSKYFPGGYLSTDENNFITGIMEKPGEGNEPSDMVNIVIHYFEDGNTLASYIRNAKTDSDDKYEVAVDKMIKDGMKIKAVPYDGFWQPIKYPWHVLDVMDFFLSKLEGIHSEDAEIADSAIIKGNVYLGKGVKVLDNAMVNGPTYIGDGSIVATNGLVRNSCVGKKCVVGFGTEVARSYFGNDVWTHTNYVGDSIIGNNVSFGSGTVTGNLRFDEKDIEVTIREQRISSGRNKFGLITGNNVRSGVNTSFMPGIKIGNNCCIGAGIVVEKDVDDGKFITGSWQLKEYENRLDISKVYRDELKKKIA
ncbi:NTP transferase domain-containing protein [Candidatus Peregrinibacteria bacterium]|nr:NTP transferase domain-containing protein [Candidatus Peregrinibacteria bacterium]